jgi:hypothetical protein
MKKRLNFLIGIGMRDYELIAEMPSISTGKAKSHFCRRRQIKTASTQFLSGNRIKRKAAAPRGQTIKA